ncbi:unnamed protein product [Acanthoscelides obtectus]|uniref:Uncharacterized protein n=1 Tax=Acanthoscelides obtectus TaxID=200917 RepID=A0A9P0LW29_ACAOB|nr:unnamed protein product [Acanthoscelides obtectus]CAK1641145.1 hypothetical protein AOBTE_LOCUS12191 [Acanthoscelides obtectus]
MDDTEQTTNKLTDAIDFYNSMLTEEGKPLLVNLLETRLVFPPNYFVSKISKETEFHRVAQALSISLSTITRIQRRLSSNDNVLRSPGKKRPRKKSKTTDFI